MAWKNKNTFVIEGMDELIRDLKKLEKVPQKHVTATSKKAMNISLKDSKANAPYDTGMLKKGIILKGEKSIYTGKKVYRIVFDPRMNEIFQKKSVNEKTITGTNRKGKTVIKKIKAGSVTGYYPISQEYGYFTKNGRFIPGFRFISNSLIDNTAKIEKTIVTTMKKKIDAEIAKVGLK